MLWRGWQRRLWKERLANQSGEDHPGAHRSQKPLSCSFIHYLCSQPQMERLEFCLKPILGDKNALFKQCSCISTKNGKKCPRVQPPNQRRVGGWVSFFAEYACKNALALYAQIKKTNPGTVGEKLLRRLSSNAKTELRLQTPESSLIEASPSLEEDSWSDGEQKPRNCGSDMEMWNLTVKLTEETVIKKIP